MSDCVNDPEPVLEAPDYPSLVDSTGRGVSPTRKLRPPIDETRKQLERGAARIATLLARRNRHVKKVEEIEAELTEARRFLRALIREVSEPTSLAPQLPLEDEP